MDAIETIDKDDKVIEIHIDEDPTSPRDPNFQDHDDVMVCFHKRYNLGDTEHGYDKDAYNSWDELEAQICKDNDIAEILPLYMYDHSGITISTTPFSCPWDSGRIGFIYITKEKARESHMVKRLSKKVMKTVHNNLIASVKEYDQYLTGQVYGFIIKDKESDEELDSCWGYYGLDYVREQAEEACKHCKVEPKPQIDPPNQMHLALTE